MNEQEMTFHLTEISRKDDEIYLLNVECEQLQEEVGNLKRDVTRLEDTIEELQADIDASNRMDR